MNLPVCAPQAAEASSLSIGMNAEDLRALVSASSHFGTDDDAWIRARRKLDERLDQLPDAWRVDFELSKAGSLPVSTCCAQIREDLIRNSVVSLKEWNRDSEFLFIRSTLQELFQLYVFLLNPRWFAILEDFFRAETPPYDLRKLAHVSRTPLSERLGNFLHSSTNEERYARYDELEKIFSHLFQIKVSLLKRPPLRKPKNLPPSPVLAEKPSFKVSRTAEEASRIPVLDRLEEAFEKNRLDPAIRERIRAALDSVNPLNGQSYLKCLSHVQRSSWYRLVAWVEDSTFRLIDAGREPPLETLNLERAEAEDVLTRQGKHLANFSEYMHVYDRNAQATDCEGYVWLRGESDEHGRLPAGTEFAGRAWQVMRDPQALYRKRGARGVLSIPF